MDFAYTSGSLVKFRDSIVTADLGNRMRARVGSIRKKKRIGGAENARMVEQLLMPSFFLALAVVS